MSPITVRYEQAVYGSFPFWDKGYAILAKSPGCREEWLADLRLACQRYGERPPGAADAGGLIALRLPSGPWAIVGPCPQGSDDRGRPGALAFHALFLTGADYRRIGAFPFAFAGQLCGDWSAETGDLPAGSVEVTPAPSTPTPALDPLAARVATALARGRRVAIEAPGPADALAREVWLALPLRRRSRLSLATWTFANGTRHDLAILPRLANVPLDRSYVDPATLSGDTSPTGKRSGSSAVGGRLGWVGLAVVAALAIGDAWRNRPVAPGHPALALAPDRVPAPPAGGPPSRPGSGRGPLSSAEEGKVVAGLIAMAERFSALDPTPTDPGRRAAELMERLRERLVYRDSLLTPSDVSAIAASADPDRARMLAWDAHVRRFLPDRPLPADFADGPLGWQVRVLAWSFHLDPGARPVEEIPHLLSESLGAPVSARPSPLASVYPALADYGRFLRRLPAR